MEIFTLASPKMLTLGIVQASLTLHSLNRIFPNYTVKVNWLIGSFKLFDECHTDGTDDTDENASAAWG